MFMIHSGTPIILTNLSKCNVHPTYRLGGRGNTFPVIRMLASVSNHAVGRRHLASAQRKDRLHFMTTCACRHNVHRILEVSRGSRRSNLLARARFSVFPKIDTIDYRSHVTSRHQLPMRTISSLGLAIPLSTTKNKISKIRIC